MTKLIVSHANQLLQSTNQAIQTSLTNTLDGNPEDDKRHCQNLIGVGICCGVFRNKQSSWLFDWNS